MLILYIKFQVPSSCGSLVLTQTKQSNRQVRGILSNSANALQNSVKSHFNIDPTQYSEFQDPS